MCNKKESTIKNYPVPKADSTPNRLEPREITICVYNTPTKSISSIKPFNILDLQKPSKPNKHDSKTIETRIITTATTTRKAAASPIARQIAPGP